MQPYEVEGLLIHYLACSGFPGWRMTCARSGGVALNDDRRVRLAIEVSCDLAPKYISASPASTGWADAVVGG
jgi:hypothetical protein